jgi:DnaK suppressor protein
MLTPEQLEHFRTLLLREREAIEARIRERDALIPTTARRPDELADPADEAALVREREEAMVANEIDRDLLERIDRALERIQNGTYGISEVSGRPIPLERLEAIPWATTLVDEEPAEED